MKRQMLSHAASMAKKDSYLILLLSPVLLTAACRSDVKDQIWFVCTLCSLAFVSSADIRCISFVSVVFQSKSCEISKFPSEKDRAAVLRRNFLQRVQF